MTVGPPNGQGEPGSTLQTSDGRAAQQGSAGRSVGACTANTLSPYQLTRPFWDLIQENEAVLLPPQLLASFSVSPRPRLPSLTRQAWDQEGCLSR